VPLRRFRTYAVSHNIRSILTQFSGTDIIGSFTNINNVWYNYSCFLECKNSTTLILNGGNFQCQTSCGNLSLIDGRCVDCSLMAATSNISRALLCYGNNTSCSVGCLACFNSTLCLFCGNLSLIGGYCVDCSLVAATSNASRALLCYGGNSNCSSHVPNCLACYNSTLCLFCQPDLILYQNSCTDCSLPYVNSTSDLILLFLCYGQNTNCVSLFPDCLVCYNSTLCLYCLGGRLVDGGCTSFPGCSVVSYIQTSINNITEVCTFCKMPIY